MDRTLLKKLKAKASDYLNEQINNQIYCVVVAACGSEYDILLLSVAVELFGAENVIVMTADTGFVDDKALSFTHKACELSGVEYVKIDVGTDFGHDCAITMSTQYKHIIFREIAHEAWIRGYSLVLDGCIESNFNINGNSAQHDMGVVSPFVQ